MTDAQKLVHNPPAGGWQAWCDTLKARVLEVARACPVPVRDTTPVPDHLRARLTRSAGDLADAGLGDLAAGMDQVETVGDLNGWLDAVRQAMTDGDLERWGVALQNGVVVPTYYGERLSTESPDFRALVIGATKSANTVESWAALTDRLQEAGDERHRVLARLLAYDMTRVIISGQDCVKVGVSGFAMLGWLTGAQWPRLYEGRVWTNGQSVYCQTLSWTNTAAPGGRRLIGFADFSHGHAVALNEYSDPDWLWVSGTVIHPGTRYLHDVRMHGMCAKWPFSRSARVGGAGTAAHRRWVVFVQPETLRPDRVYEALASGIRRAYTTSGAGDDGKPLDQPPVSVPEWDLFVVGMADTTHGHVAPDRLADAFPDWVRPTRIHHCPGWTGWDRWTMALTDQE